MRIILSAIKNPSQILPYLKRVVRGMRLKKYIGSSTPYHLEKLGSKYGGWIVPTNIIASD